MKYEKNELELNKENKKNLPEKKFRASPITVTIWKNQSSKDGEQIEFNTISFERTYKDKEGEWKTTTTLRVNDLPKAEIALKKAYEYLILKRQDITEEGIC